MIKNRFLNSINIWSPATFSSILYANVFFGYFKNLDPGPGSGPWTWTLNPDPEKPGPWEIWTQKNLDSEKPGLWKTWTMKNAGNSWMQKKKKDWKTTWYRLLTLKFCLEKTCKPVEHLWWRFSTNLFNC